MTSSIIQLACILSFTLFANATTLLEDIYITYETHDRYHQCSLMPNTQVNWCRVPQRNRFVPAHSSRLTFTKGSQCAVKSPVNNRVECLICDHQGVWRTSECFGVEYHSRVKRFWPFMAGIFFGYVACAILCPKGDSEPDYRPPYFTDCAKNAPSSPVYAEIGQTGAIVNWTVPKAKDGKGKEISVQQSSGFAGPGGRFPRGFHSITYKATDKHGFSAHCPLSFEVKVATCSPPTLLENGRRVCKNGEIIFGSACTFSCSDGYNLQGPTTITCQRNGSFDNTAPKCEPKTCTTLAVPKFGKNYKCTNSNYFMSFCTLTCDQSSGFSVSNPKITFCQANQQWKQPLPECVDSAGPVFDNCPTKSIVAYADKLKKSAKVSWPQITATDNSGKVSVTLTDGQQPGTEFAEDTHIIEYTAEDDARKRTLCRFSISVQILRCFPPHYNDTNLKYSCHKSYLYGSKCTVSCKLGFPLAGANTLICEKDNSVKPKMFWDLGGNTPPYCEKRPCPDLNIPKNGALACDSNTVSSFCTMSCNVKWDIPRTAPSSNMFICGWASGTWQPISDVPDCTEKRNPRYMNLPSELYYYTGNCGTNETLLEIKQKFLQVMNNTGTWKNGCPSNNECTINNVQVECGEVTSRRKREERHDERDTERKRRETDEKIKYRMYHKRTKRSEKAVKIKFGITLKYIPGNGSVTESINAADNILNAIAANIDSDTKANRIKIDNSDLQLRDDSFGYGRSEFVCEASQKPVFSKASCSSCPTGTMYSTSERECIRCPVGTYQESDDAAECTRCPEGHTTLGEGERNSSSCIAFCTKGQSSPTGAIPCTPCPAGQYQPASGSTECLACPSGETTLKTGSVTADSCKSYDLILKGPVKITSKDVLSEDINNVTLLLWYKTSAVSSTSPVITVRNNDSAAQLTLTLGQDISASLFGEEVKSAVSVKAKKWTHVALTLDHGSKKLSMYKGGIQLTSKTLTSVTTPSLFAGSTVEVSIETNQVASIRSLDIIQSVKGVTHIKTMAGSCDTITDADATMSLHHLKANEDTSVRVVTPSVCDAVDECLSSPCNGHPCENLQGGFKCHCQDGFSGTNCSTLPDYCSDHQCENSAVCENGNTNYTCKCTEKFRGTLCSEKIINGDWSEYGDWTPCSVTCGGGKRFRYRRCDNPSPGTDGKSCDGSDTLEEVCNTGKCPACRKSDLRYGLGAKAYCTGTEFALNCTAGCKEADKVPDPKFPSVYRCENGIWSPENTKMPSCTKLVSSSVLTLQSGSQYSNEGCFTESKITAIKAGIKRNVQNLACDKDPSCEIDVVVASCGSGPKRKRSVENTVKIVLRVKLPSGDLDLEAYRSSKTLSPQLTSIVEAVKVIEASAKVINDSSSSIFDVTVDGVKYTVQANSLTFTPDVTCPHGSEVRDVFCVYCPVGSYYKNSACEFCDKGTYQDRTGQTTCNKCPSGKTTVYVGSTNISDCTEEGASLSTHGPIETSSEIQKGKQNDSLLIILVSVASVSGALMLIPVSYLLYKKMCRKRPSKTKSMLSLSKVSPQLGNYCEKPTFRNDPTQNSTSSDPNFLLENRYYQTTPNGTAPNGWKAVAESP